MKKMIVFLALTICAASLHAQVDWSTKPHLKRTSPNLAQNPSFNGTDYWGYGGTAAYDSTVSRTPGSDSLKLTAPWPVGGGVQSSFVPVTPGKLILWRFTGNPALGQHK